MSKITKKRILVVDDSPVVLAQLSDLLCDYEVITAESGVAAIEILEEPVRDRVCFSNLFDLIITDLVMPTTSGLDLAQYVKKRNRANKYTPVILLTSGKISKEEARSSGCVDCFPKLEVDRLLATVRILMSY